MKRKPKRTRAYTWNDFDREQAIMRQRGKRKSLKRLHCPTEFQQLRSRCLASIRDFYSEGEVCGTPNGKYIYRDNGASVLAVAHLDVVQPQPRHFGHRKGDADIIYNCQLDDRLGAWIILDLLPTLGVEVDVLLTEGEEFCRSTAEYFQPTKDYNWLIEFDRAGTDVVMYDYETPELVELLCQFGNDVGWGSYSDITVMEHLAVAGFNWGIGYCDGHWRSSRFSVSECREAVARFVEFYQAHKDIKFPHYPNENETDRWLYEEDKEWLRDMEARQNLDDGSWNEEEEYRRLWEETEGQRQWEEERWGHNREFDWEDCFSANHYA